MNLILALAVASCVTLPGEGRDTPPGSKSPSSPEGRTPVDAPRASSTPAQLKALLAEYGKLTTLSVEYEIQMRPSSPGDDGSQSGVHRRIVAKSPCSLLHDSGHMSHFLDWKDDPYRQTCIFDESSETIFFHFNKAFGRRPYPANGPLEGTLAAEFFFVATGLWPIPGRQFSRPTDYPYLLTEVARSDGHDRVREALEAVDGTWCHVLVDEGKDALWIDASRGARILKREACASSGAALMARYTLAGHRELLPGVWCPMKIRSEQFDFGAPTPEGRMRHVIDSEAVLSDASIELPGGDVFHPAPGPGWLEYHMDDVRARPSQAVPGGEGLLDDAVAWIAKYRTPAERPRIGQVITMSHAISIAFLVLLVELILQSSRRIAGSQN